MLLVYMYDVVVFIHVFFSRLYFVFVEYIVYTWMDRCFLRQSHTQILCNNVGGNMYIIINLWSPLATLVLVFILIRFFFLFFLVITNSRHIITRERTNKKKSLYYFKLKKTKTHIISVWFFFYYFFLYINYSV